MSQDAVVRVTLTRDLGLFDIAMIGAGIFGLTGNAASLARPGLLIAFALNGLTALLTAAPMVFIRQQEMSRVVQA